MCHKEKKNKGSGAKSKNIYFSLNPYSTIQTTWFCDSLG